MTDLFLIINQTVGSDRGIVSVYLVGLVGFVLAFNGKYLGYLLGLAAILTLVLLILIKTKIQV